MSLNEQSMPFRWPAAWSDARLLEVLKGSPINCVIDAPPAVAEAARAAHIEVVSRNEAAAAVQFVADPVWPGVRAARRGEGADAGPTGAPWVDANAWSIQLTRALHPGKTVWVEAVPEKGSVQNDSAYVLTIAEAEVYGARWVVALDDKFAEGLAGGDATALARWRKIAETLRFFGERRAWASFEPRANLAVISEFAGDNEFMAKEFLNLAARRNLAYRIVPKRPGLELGGAASILYLDEQPPDAQLAALLKGAARNGALLVASRGSGIAAWGEKPTEGPIPSYEYGAFGKGKIAIPRKAWEDPWMVAAEVRILIGRRTDVVRLFNTGPMGALYAREKKAGSGVVQLLNYTRYRTAGVSVATADEYGRAQVLSLEQPSAGPVNIAAESGHFNEIPMPPFSVYSAIELSQPRRGKHA